MYSVVVIGAGPAGSTTARFLSELGHDILLIDRKNVVGVPKQCAEGLFKTCFSEFSMESGSFISGRARYLEVVFPNGTKYLVRDDICMLDRPGFDQNLLWLAESSGAELMLGEKVKSVNPETGEVRLDRNGKTIRSQVIVGADGPASNVARSLGLKNKLIPAAQVEMAWPRDDVIHAYLDKNLSPYACWIFPKSNKRTANVGCFGTMTNLRNFMSNHKIEGEVIEENRGAIPLGTVPELQQGRVLLIGDAGGLTSPFTGGGLYPAAHSARIASQAIDRFLKGEKLDYESKVRKDFISSSVHMRARNLLASLDNEELNQLGNAMNGLIFPGVKFSSSPSLILRVLRHPGIVKIKYAPLLEVILRYCLAGKIW
ncbi:MAG: geranylgeranyl reductase family protein [Methanotrichaceae archaeon]